MKVGTDGVLLGAWANIINSKTALDIGSGTGLIAIMLAQRGLNLVDAVEIDINACQQAAENIKACKWNNKITLHNSSFQNYIKNCTQKFDLIISNPPFFIDSLEPPEKERAIARHNNTLTFNDIIVGVKILLADNGLFSVILPYVEGCIFIAEAAKFDLYCNRKTEVKPSPIKKTKRLLLEFATKKLPLVENTLIIDSGDRHDYTIEYKELTSDFYLAF